jgi:adenosylhomocysteinase
VQALALHGLAAGEFPVGLNRFSDELDELIARTKLETLGIELDSLTESQRRALEEWRA